MKYPEATIQIEAQPYDEKKVMENIVRQGKNVISAHLKHLREHQQTEYLEQALSFLEEKGIVNPLAGHERVGAGAVHMHGNAPCPGARSRELSTKKSDEADPISKRLSQLTHWPIQLHLMSPLAPQYKGKDVLLSADCVAYAVGDIIGEDRV